MLPVMKQTGEKEGINFSYGGEMGNTTDSHRLMEWALETYGAEKQNVLMEECFKLYFEEEKNVADTEVLLTAVDRAGLDRAKAADFLSSGDGDDEVHHKVKALQRQYRVSGVPFFIIDDKIKFSGAQDVDLLVDVLEDSM